MLSLSSKGLPFFFLDLGHCWTLKSPNAWKAPLVEIRKTSHTFHDLKNTPRQKNVMYSIPLTIKRALLLVLSSSREKEREFTFSFLG